MNTLGSIGVWLGFLSALSAVALALIGRSNDKTGEQAKRAAYFATLVAGIGMTIGVVVLIVAFFTKDYSIFYVLSQRSLDESGLAWLFTLSGLWAGQAGSILFWTWLMTLFAGYLALRNSVREDGDGLHSMSLMVLNIIIAVFSLLMVATEGNNPFIATPGNLFVGGELSAMAAGYAMNPLLEHWAMILHPPTLFIGYAGLAVPFAYAMGALISGNLSAAWIKQSDRITVFSWVFLGIGIGLGAVWAYVVLGWGGFWAWDPVENASIFPWFVGVALIHSMTVYRRKGNARMWALMLAAFTFVTVVMGTFITRSGAFAELSVHSFGKDPVAHTLFLTLMIASMAAMVLAIFIRRDNLHNASEFESMTSKDAMYYLNNVIMTAATVIIMVMTIAPIFTKRSFLPIHYEALARPLGLLYIALLAVCPILSWGKTDGKTFWDRAKLPLALTTVPFALLVWNWYVNLRPVYGIMAASATPDAHKFTMYGEALYTIIAMLGFFLGSFLITNTTLLFVRGAKARAKAQKESFIKALGSILIKARAQSGGYISHIAMGIIVIGLVGSVMYVQTASFHLANKPGESFEIAGNTFTLTGYEHVDGKQDSVEKIAHFDVVLSNGQKRAISPNLHFTQHDHEGEDGDGDRRANATVISLPLKDVFVTLESFSENAGEVVGLVIRVMINPLIWFTWGGFGLLTAGSALAMWPKKTAQEASGKPGKSAKKKKK